MFHTCQLEKQSLVTALLNILEFSIDYIHVGLVSLHINVKFSNLTSRTVSISNRSDIIVQFKWSNFATLREELQQKDRYSNLLLVNA